mgnify:CR=1 FL=1
MEDSTPSNLIIRFSRILPLPYPVCALVICLILYAVGFVISLVAGSPFDFISSWAFLVGVIGLWVTITTAFWFARSYPIVINEVRSSFELPDNECDFFSPVFRFLRKPELICLSSAPYLLLALSVIITYMIGARSIFLPGISSNLTRSWIFMAYVIMWATLISAVLGGVVCGVVGMLCFLRRIKNMKVFLNFLHPDGVYGLSPLTKVVLRVSASYFFVTSLFLIWLITYLEFGSLLLIGSISFLGVMIFLLPEFCLHIAISNSKQQFLQDLSLIYSQELKRVVSAKGAKDKESMMALTTALDVFDKVSDRGTWAFNTTTLVKLSGLAISPLTSTLAKILLAPFLAGLI